LLGKTTNLECCLDRPLPRSRKKRVSSFCPLLSYSVTAS